MNNNQAPSRLETMEGEKKKRESPKGGPMNTKNRVNHSESQPKKEDGVGG